MEAARAHPTERDPRPGSPPIDATVPAARSVARSVLRPVFRAWLRLRVEGAGHVPASGPVLIASTHASHADSIALGTSLHRPVHFLGDERLTRWPLLGPWLPRFGMVPIQRGTRDVDALDRLGALLDVGAAIVVYPEGARSRDGRVYRPRSGVARLAADRRVPVVPAAVAGSYEVWPSGSRPRLRGGRVRLVFGPPLDPPRADPASRRTFNRRLHDELVRLSGAEPADTFAPVHGGADPEESTSC